MYSRKLEGEVKIVDLNLETKELGFNRHRKSGESSIIKEESIGYNPSKKDCGYKITCVTDGRFLNLFY